MAMLFILLWLISAILLITDWRDSAHRWLSAVTFFSGCGSLSVILEEYPLEVMARYMGMTYTINPTLIGFLSSLSHHIAPYAFFVYTIITTTFMGEGWNRWKDWLKVILLIPPMFMYMLFSFHGGYDPSFAILTVWVGPYVILGNLLLFLNYYMAEHPKEKQQKLFSCIILAPMTLYALLSNYILRIFENHDAWRLHRWFILVQFLLFLLFSGKYGALGVKIRLEKNHTERTRKTISSGTAIVSHTIKNEIIKISMCADNIKLYCQEPNQYITDSLEIISESTNHLHAMVSRINEQMSDIILDRSDYCLKEICETALMMGQNSLERKNIFVKKEYGNDGEVFCDAVHIKEVIINILKNAEEAMEKGGTISIALQKEKKGVTLTIRDNGKGIAQENLEKVLEPFFTTKKHTLNFGLGLSYCHNVMDRHGGSLEVISKEGQGTTVLLHFPTEIRWWQRFKFIEGK